MDSVVMVAERRGYTANNFNSITGDTDRTETEEKTTSEVVSIDDLITNNMKLVHKAVNQLHIPNNEKEDAVAEGMLALVRAANNYSEHRETKFSTYAYSCILEKVKWFKIKSKPIKYTTEVLKLTTKVYNYMRGIGIMSPAGLTEKEWESLGVFDNDIKGEVVSYFTHMESIDEDDSEDEPRLEIADTSIRLDENICTEGLIESINYHIDTTYVRESDGTRDAMKKIVCGLIQNDDTVGYTQVADELGIKRQTVFRNIKKLQNDVELKSIIESYME